LLVYDIFIEIKQKSVGLEERLLNIIWFKVSLEDQIIW